MLFLSLHFNIMNHIYASFLFLHPKEAVVDQVRRVFAVVSCLEQYMRHFGHQAAVIILDATIPLL